MTQKSPNRLAQETSVYLRQHAENPIHWYPWGEEAFAAARREKKLIFLSIGYSTCHWCHVMEGDSFDRDDVAAILNAHYIAIKVDREERPDVDAIYMRAVQAMTGRGGWPLSLVLTPDLRPCWGGTFLPRDQFKAVLGEIQKVWAGPRHEEVFATSHAIADHIAHTVTTPRGKEPVSDRLLQAFVDACAESFDPVHGGFGGAPKFPAPWSLVALLRVHRRSKDPQALHMVELSLKAMMNSGLHDHVGGGFHRYSTDAQWMVPHFEKMLYDNAQLALAYAEAYQATGHAAYAHVLRGILAYVIRDLGAPEGGFFAAEDADSEKTEGKFYVWTAAELRALLSTDEWTLLQSFYDIRDEGNFHVDHQVMDLEHAAGLKTPEQANILHAPPDVSLPWGDPAYESVLAKLKHARDRRQRPLRDNKLLTGWNGLMLAALAKGAQVLGDDIYAEAARTLARFLLQNTCRAGELYHSYSEGQLGIPGLLEDYAYVIYGLLELYQTDFDVRWYQAAFALQEKQIALFWSDADGYFYETDGKDANLIIRTNEFFDNATPAGNAISLINLSKFHTFPHSNLALKGTDRLWQVMGPQAMRFPKAFAATVCAAAFVLDAPKTVLYVKSGDASKDKRMLDALRNMVYNPHTSIAAMSSAGDAKLFAIPGVEPSAYKPGYAYVCEGDTCHSPTDYPQDLEEILGRAAPLTSGAKA